MKIGINTFLFTSPFTNQSTRLFAKFKAWGFDGVEVVVEDPTNFDPKWVRAELDRHQLTCTSLCACYPEFRDLRGTRTQQQASVRYTKDLIDMTEVMGARRIIGPLYSSVGRANAVPASEYRRQWKTVVKNLQNLCAYAEKRNVTLCLEPLNRFETDFINTVDQGLKMIRDVRSPALKFLLDTFHMNIEEKNLPAAIRRAGKHVGHIHASGSDRGTPGNDHLDWTGIGKALKDIRYDGSVVIESFTTDVAVIARAAAIWRKIEPRRDDIARDGVKFLKKTLN